MAAETTSFTPAEAYFDEAKDFDAYDSSKYRRKDGQEDEAADGQWTTAVGWAGGYSYVLDLKAQLFFYAKWGVFNTHRIGNLARILRIFHVCDRVRHML